MPARNRGRLALAALLLATPFAEAAFAEATEETSAETTAETTEETAADRPGEATLDPIYVTGEKVNRDLRHTAASVSVRSGEAIAAESPAATDVTAALSGAANLLYTDTVGTPVIRGQDAQGPHNGANAFFAGTVPRATINLDGHYLSYNEFYFGTTSIWDVESVELFRGPQTTSQGANAIAGAIVVRTRDPDFTRNGAWQLEAGNYNQRRASFAFGTPLGQDLALRFSLDHASRDTFIDYINPGFVQNDIGQDFSSETARMKLLWQPLGLPGLEVKLTYARMRATRPSQEAAAAPYHDYGSLHASMPSWDQTTDTLVLDVDYAMDNGLALFSQTQVSRSDVRRDTGLTHGGDAEVDAENLSNETRLAFGDASSRWSGLLGLYHARTDQDETLDLTGAYTWVNNHDSAFRDEKTNTALFGETTWRPDPRWQLTAGLRLQHDEVARAGHSTYSPTRVDYDESFTALLPKLTLAHDLTPGWTLGGMIAKGYNPGGTSLNFSTGEWIDFDKEESWNYELFTRAALLGDRLQLTGNLFYTDYTDGQFNIPVLVDGVYYSYTINAEAAKAYGLEAGASYQLTEALRLEGNLGLLRTRLDEVSGNAAYVGNAFAKAPAMTFSAGAQWQASARFSLGGKVSMIDGYYSDTANTEAYKVDRYTLVDLNSRYRLSDRVELYGFINNVFDERVPTALQAARGTSVFTAASMTAPRTFGIGLRGTF